MDNTFFTSLKQDTNFTETENGAITHKSTLNKVFDMFAFGGAYSIFLPDIFENEFKKELSFGNKRVSKLPGNWRIFVTYGVNGHNCFCVSER